MRNCLNIMIVVTVLGVGASGPLVAQADEADIAAAKKAFKSGQEAMNAERYADAVVEFKKAYDITKDGLVMGQVALAYEKAGDYEAALEALQVYREALPAADRGAIDDMMLRYRKKITDGESRKLKLSSDLPPPDKSLTQPADGTEGPGADQGAGSTAKKGRFWTWIAAGSAGAVALSALVVGLNAQSKYDDLKSSCAPTCHIAHQSEVDSVKTRAIAADVLWGIAAAAAVTAGVLYFVEGRGSSDESESSAAAPAADDEGLGGGEEEEEEEEFFERVQVAPMLGHGRVGAGAVIRF